jgi:transposase
LSGKGDLVDRVVGLETGADDYITKPFELREVLARIRTVLRRAATRDASAASEPSLAANVNASEVLVFEGWRLDLVRRELRWQTGESVPLTAGEFELLRAFTTNPNRVLNRDQLIDLAKGREWAAYDRGVDTQVMRTMLKPSPLPTPGSLRTALGGSLPTHARAKIVRMLDRLELLLIQITELEKSRDAVLEDANPDKAASMIQQLAKLRGVGVQSATVLVREGFVREFANGKALGSYAGLTSTPYSSGGTEREQGIGKAGNARLRTLMVELAWLWQRYQPDSAQVSWFRERVSGTGRRMRKVMVVALARKLLIALWRFATQGVVPEGAVMKPAT